MLVQAKLLDYRFRPSETMQWEEPKLPRTHYPYEDSLRYQIQNMEQILQSHIFH